MEEIIYAYRMFLSFSQANFHSNPKATKDFTNIKNALARQQHIEITEIHMAIYVVYLYIQYMTKVGQLISVTY